MNAWIPSCIAGNLIKYGRKNILMERSCAFASLVAATLIASCSGPGIELDTVQKTKQTPVVCASLDEWISREAIPFSVDSSSSFATAADSVIASLGDTVELLGFGEALHGGEEILRLRNMLFKRLVEAHDYSAIAVESGFPRSRLVNDYVSGRGPESYDAVRDAGFSHGFGLLEANRELVEWMKAYNADPARRVKLRFYGFDSPTEMMSADSPRRSLNFVLDYLASVDPVAAGEYRERIEPLLGKDSDWENPAAMMDPSRSIGASLAATALRIQTEDLIIELRTRRPELAARSGGARYAEAVQYAEMARQLLDYHAVMAQQSAGRNDKLVAIRDMMMADNLEYIVSREKGRGKVLAFAHNEHLKRGMAKMQLGPAHFQWWPAGAQLNEMLGPRYAVIGSAVGVSEANGIGLPEAGTIEARLAAVRGTALFIPTHRGRGLPDGEISALPARSGSRKNPTYMPLTPKSPADFDWLLFVESTGYNRGGPALQYPEAGAPGES